MAFVIRFCLFGFSLTAGFFSLTVVLAVVLSLVGFLLFLFGLFVIRHLGVDLRLLDIKFCLLDNGVHSLLSHLI